MCFAEYPAIPRLHQYIRLETAFGGGKTHSLIACVHIANRGTELATVTEGVLDASYLPDPGTVTVVGIAGDEIPVNRTKGDGLVPYTLWGEIAYQIGGKELYNDVQNEAESFAAPGKNFLECVLGNRKLLIRGYEEHRCWQPQTRIHIM